MATISTAQKKWADSMKDAGHKWKKMTTGKGKEYAEGMATFGAPVGSVTRGRWERGVERVTASDFQKTVEGKEEKWARKLKEAVAI